MISDIEIKFEKENSIVYVEINDIITVKVGQKVIAYDYDKDNIIILNGITHTPNESKITVSNNTNHQVKIRLSKFQCKRMTFLGVFDYIQLWDSSIQIMYVFDKVRMIAFSKSKVTKKCFLNALRVGLFNSHINLLYSYLYYTKVDITHNSSVQRTNIHHPKIIEANLVVMDGFHIPLEDMFESEICDNLVKFLVEISI